MMQIVAVQNGLSPPFFYWCFVKSFGGTQTTDLWESDVRLFWERLGALGFYFRNKNLAPLPSL
jgi:hypothetical protein